MFNNINDSILKKKAIVDVIVKLMDEEGLKNITIKDICDEAHISVGAFYHYFTSKDSIPLEMYELMDKFFLFYKEDIFNHSTAAEDILDFVRHFGMFVEQWGYFANLLIIRYSVERLPDNNNLPRKIYGILKEIIMIGIEEKQLSLRIDPDELVSTVFVLIRGYLLEWTKKGQNYPVKENMVKHTEWLLSAVQN